MRTPSGYPYAILPVLLASFSFILPDPPTVSRFRLLVINLAGIALGIAFSDVTGGGGRPG